LTSFGQNNRLDPRQQFHISFGQNQIRTLINEARFNKRKALSDQTPVAPTPIEYTPRYKQHQITIPEIEPTKSTTLANSENIPHDTPPLPRITASNTSYSTFGLDNSPIPISNRTFQPIEAITNFFQLIKPPSPILFLLKSIIFFSTATIIAPSTIFYFFYKESIRNYLDRVKMYEKDGFFKWCEMMGISFEDNNDGGDDNTKPINNITISALNTAPFLDISFSPRYPFGLKLSQNAGNTQMLQFLFHQFFFLENLKPIAEQSLLQLIRAENQILQMLEPNMRNQEAINLLQELAIQEQDNRAQLKLQWDEWNQTHQSLLTSDDIPINPDQIELKYPALFVMYDVPNFTNFSEIYFVLETIKSTKNSLNVLLNTIEDGNIKYFMSLFVNNNENSSNTNSFDMFFPTKLQQPLLFLASLFSSLALNNILIKIRDSHILQVYCESITNEDWITRSIRNHNHLSNKPSYFNSLGFLFGSESSDKDCPATSAKVFRNLYGLISYLSDKSTQCYHHDDSNLQNNQKKQNNPFDYSKTVTSQLPSLYSNFISTLSAKYPKFSTYLLPRTNSSHQPILTSDNELSPQKEIPNTLSGKEIRSGVGKDWSKFDQQFFDLIYLMSSPSTRVLVSTTIAQMKNIPILPRSLFLRENVRSFLEKSCKSDEPSQNSQNYDQIQYIQAKREYFDSLIQLTNDDGSTTLTRAAIDRKMAAFDDMFKPIITSPTNNERNTKQTISEKIKTIFSTSAQFIKSLSDEIKSLFVPDPTLSQLQSDLIATNFPHTVRLYGTPYIPQHHTILLNSHFNTLPNSQNSTAIKNVTTIPSIPAMIPPLGAVIDISQLPIPLNPDEVFDDDQTPQKPHPTIKTPLQNSNHSDSSPFYNIHDRKMISTKLPKGYLYLQSNFTADQLTPIMPISHHVYYPIVSFPTIIPQGIDFSQTNEGSI
jgi:hypothetical protein